MGCEVEFREDTTDKIQNVTLVYPAQAIYPGEVFGANPCRNCVDWSALRPVYYLGYQNRRDPATHGARGGPRLSR